MTDKKIAIVTGAGSGIGRAIALALAKDGCAVVAVDINNADLNDTCNTIREFNIDTMPVICDIGKVGQIKNMVEIVIKNYGRVDILVNNAGIASNVPIEKITEEDWDHMLDVNLKGTFFCSQLVFSHMQKQNSGKIISISSITAERGGLFTSASYAASKAGVIALMKSFARSGGVYGITANSIAPGIVDTKMSERLKSDVNDVPLGRMAKVEEIAYAVCFLASDKADYITGMTIDINGGQLMR